jgi:hypothetical protein
LTRKLQPRLPEGTDVTAAAAGFKSLNAFVSAVNVSANLHIPFDKLKAKIVTEKKSLSQAIQALKPASSAAIEVQRAEYDARGMIAESEAEQAAAPAPVSQQPKAKSKPSPKRAVGG